MNRTEEPLSRAPIGSTVRMLFVAQGEGRHVFRARARAQSNGQGAPEMWLELLLNGRRERFSGTQGWAQGCHEVVLELTLQLDAGSACDLLALSGYCHANACSIELEGCRVEPLRRPPAAALRRPEPALTA